MGGRRVGWGVIERVIEEEAVFVGGAGGVVVVMDCEEGDFEFLAEEGGYLGGIFWGDRGNVGSEFEGLVDLVGGVSVECE